MSFKERFQGNNYPVCMPYPHEPDIKLGYIERGNGYRLFCQECGARAINAIGKVKLSPNERENAVELVPRKN